MHTTRGYLRELCPLKFMSTQGPRRSTSSSSSGRSPGWTARDAGRRPLPRLGGGPSRRRRPRRPRPQRRARRAGPRPHPRASERPLGRRKLAAMAGHSKWAGIKHKKAIVDSRRGKLFTKLARAITVAAKEGGGDPDGNPRARARHLEGQGRLDAQGQHRARDRQGHRRGRRRRRARGRRLRGLRPRRRRACSSRRVTDNRNRTGSEVRHLFSKHGGSLGEPGSVAYLFDKKGLVVVDGERYSEDDLMVAIDAGAEDIAHGRRRLRGPHRADRPHRRARRRSRRPASRSRPPRSPSSPRRASRSTRTAPPSCCKLIDALEDNDDVDAVHANFDVDAEVLERVAAV